MTISTYSELLTAIGNYAVRTDTTTLAPEYVVLAEAYLNRVLRTADMTETTTGTVTGGTYVIAKPTGFLGVRQLRLTSGSYFKLEPVSIDKMDEMKAQTDVSGEPQYFAEVGSNLELYPEPGSDTPYKLSYYKRLPALASNSTNWLLTSHPDVYLYASLVEYGIRSMDDHLPLWRERLDVALSALSMNRELAGGDRLTPQINRSIA